MIVQGFGEILADAMTVNPALKDLPSASAILDTSNYTFQAVTFGKDSDGFTRHSHAISSIEYVDGDPASGVSGYNSGRLIIINLGSNATNGASSYVTSATYLTYSSTYNSVPNDPFVSDVRLSRASTLSTNLSAYQYASALPDLGHYANPALDPQLSAIWNVVGAFAPPTFSNIYEYRFHDKNSVFSFSGYLTSYFNNNEVMDKNGYLTISPSSISENVGNGNYGEGSLLFSGVSFPVSGGYVRLDSLLRKGDAASLAAFGGVKHVGVYCLDLKSMLASGLTPPYSWDALNNNRKYKLVAKATILEDAVHHRDSGTDSGFDTLVTDSGSNVIISLIFDFK